MKQEFSRQTRQAALERFGSEEFDVLVVGGGITGAAVARQLQRLLQSTPLPPPSGGVSVEFFTSGDAAQASSILSKLWGEEISAQRLPSGFC